MIKILFDVTPIVKGAVNNTNRSGIYFCTYNILNELTKRQNICVDYYCDSIFISKSEDELEKCIGRKICVINKNTLNNRISQWWNEVERGKRIYKEKGRVWCSYLLAVLEIIIMKIAQQIDNLTAYDDACDIFFSTCTQAPKRLYRSEKILKVIVLHDVIQIIYPEYFPTRLQGFRESWLHYLLRTMNNHEVFLANSYCTKKDFLKYRPDIKPDRIHVVHHAAGSGFLPCKDTGEIDAVKERYHIPSDKKYMFSLCAIEPRKNLIRVVRTFMQFIEKNHIEDLVIALGGKAWDSFKSQFEDEAGTVMDSKYVIKMGYVQDEDLPILYSGAEWFVYTSQYEGFGVPPLEAMCCGCPVIASNNSSIPEVVGDAGLLIPWDSDEAHVEAYEKYYFDRELRRNLAQRGLERSRKFTWKKSVENIMRLIDDHKMFGS